MPWEEFKKLYQKYDKDNSDELDKNEHLNLIRDLLQKHELEDLFA